MRSSAGSETKSHVLPLGTPVQELAGVGPTRAKLLNDLGGNTLGELLEYFPRSYQYESEEREIRALEPGTIQQARGKVIAVDYIPTRPRPRFEATLDDGTGILSGVWFHGAYLRKSIHPGMMV